MQFVLVATPRDAPLRNSSTEAQLAYALAVMTLVSRLVNGNMPVI